MSLAFPLPLFPPYSFSKSEHISLATFIFKIVFKKSACSLKRFSVDSDFQSRVHMMSVCVFVDGIYMFVCLYSVSAQVQRPKESNDCLSLFSLFL